MHALSIRGGENGYCKQYGWFPDHFDTYKKATNQPFFITNEEGCSYRVLFEKYLLTHNIHNFRTMELWSIAAIKQMVMSGLGFAVLPYMTVKEEVEGGKLKVLSHSEKFDPIYSHMLIKKKRWPSPAVEAFVDIVLKSFGEKEKNSTQGLSTNTI